MSFWVPSNFRQLPQTWEMSQPFRIGGNTVAIQGPAGVPALNWAPVNPTTTVQPSQQLLIPAYQYPTLGTWATLTAAIPPPAMMIANISGVGAGASSNPDYVTAINNARTAGIRILGYIDTNYTTRPTANIPTELANWATWYGITDIFLDRVSSDVGAHYTWYSGVVTTIRNTNPNGLVVLNCGVYPDESYMSLGDIVVVFEDTFVNYVNSVPPVWVFNHPPQTLAHLVHDCVNQDAMNVALTQARAQNALTVYVNTDPSYATLPTYFAAENTAIVGTTTVSGFQGPWDSGTIYNTNDAVVYNNMIWSTSQQVTGVPPLSPMVDDQGDPITDVNGNPIYPWASVVNWNASTAYKVNDAVMYMSQSWMCVIANSGVPPGTSPLDNNGNPILDTNGNPVIPWSVLPFKLGTGGGVSYDTDPVLWAQNHILALLLTTPGERVMRPGYGAGLRAFVFENNDPFVEQTITSAMQQNLQSWEPNITINDVSMKPDLFNAGLVNIVVHFSVGASPTRHSIAFSMGGVGVEVMS